MSENKWSPFDPEWYKYAFDKFVSTAEELFYQNEIIAQGYNLPDADGSKSSVFRSSAVLNNSFNEELLRETLKDIYINSSHKLIASNHDNVHFFKWMGSMQDMSIVPNTDYCEIQIPTENFIQFDLRDKYKLTQFYRKWISITELMQNWDTFKWTLLLFINQRVYSEYLLRIDDQVCTLRFKYQNFWMDKNYSVFVYKFDTNYQTRIKLPSEAIFREDRWNWKVPVATYFKETKISEFDKVVVTFNRIAEDRSDGMLNVDAMGDNLEFLEVDSDGNIDISNISDFNKRLLRSEYREPLWMSIFVPKFFHEFPIPLATDVVYRPYNGKYNKLWTLYNGEYHEVKSDLDPLNPRNVVINLDEKNEEWDDGWRYVIRPLVLSDAFDTQSDDPYDQISELMNHLNDTIISAADTIEQFHLFMNSYTSDFDFFEHCDATEAAVNAVFDEYNDFLSTHNIDENIDYNTLMVTFGEMLAEARVERKAYKGFKDQYTKGDDFWIVTSKLLDYARELISRYDIVKVLSNITDNTLWENELKNQFRFRRPIDESDFWTFKYYADDKVWRPYPLSMKRHFPDVYTFEDGNEITPNEIYKAFFFYSDTANVRKQTSDIVKASPSWDDDMEEFMYNRGASYRDIFMEKFYWMGVRSIYKGIIRTQYRWEVLEYIQDNKSYDRFNQLFMNTMEPYFKMGLATYLKSDDYEFPFDFEINKMQEAINEKFLNYQRITNFEMYLDKTWSPSYFDYVAKIMDDWDPGQRLIRRPGSTFDTTRLISIIMDIQNAIQNASTILNDQVNTSLEKINEYGYVLSKEYLEELSTKAGMLDDNIQALYQFVTNLDMDIYSISHIQMIGAMFTNHLNIVNSMRDQFDLVYNDALAHSTYDAIQDVLTRINGLLSSLDTDIQNIEDSLISFDINHFMYGVNNPDYFNEKDHKDDTSLIGSINNFGSSWSNKTLELRNELYESTVSLWTKYNGDTCFSVEEIGEIISIMEKVSDDINNLKEQVFIDWNGESKDLNIIAHFDFATEYISTGIESMNLYLANLLVAITDFESMDAATDVLVNIGLTVSELEWIESYELYRNSIIDELSYLDISKHISSINRLKANIDSIFNNWDEFNTEEAEVFIDIMGYTKSPTAFILEMDSYKDTILAINDYINSCSKEFVPDKTLPNYSDIYTTEEIEIISGGFGHEIGEEVYIPYVGNYVITSIDDTIHSATGLAKLSSDPYDYKTYRDPVSDQREYNSSTNGHGLGIIVKCTASSKERIINDSVTEPYIAKAENIIYLINRDKQAINPYNNDSVRSTIEKINLMESDWNNLLSFYSDYLSEDRKQGIQDLIDVTIAGESELMQLINTRDRIDLNGSLTKINEFIISTYSLYQSRHKITPNYLYFDNRLRTVYNDLLLYYGNGSSWNDETELREKLNSMDYELQLFKRLVLDKTLGDPSDPDNANILNLYNESIASIVSINEALDELPAILNNLQIVTNNIQSEIDSVPEAQIDEWYRLDTVAIASGGSGYLIGDIVQLTISRGNPIYVQINKITEDGSVRGIRPILDYALPKQYYGTYETITKVGNGTGLVVNVVSSKVDKNDSTYFLDATSDHTKPDQFDDNDLFAFKFENIHDLAIGYEVYLAGKQISDFVVRHEIGDQSLNGTDVDVIYINANEVMNLQNASVRFDGENYFIYKIDDVELLSPGKGYTVGQDIIADSGEVALKLKVASLKNTPFKEIESVDLMENNTLFSGADPKSDFALVVEDSVDNIDDEYNEGYYDHLTSEGITKPLTRGYPVEEYPYTSTRFDDLEDGLRNKNYMYATVDMPDTEDAAKDGDPDEHNYLGSRVDNSQVPYVDEHRWDGIEPKVPHMDPFIPDAKRLPPDQYTMGEFQEIAHIRIFNTGLDDNTNEVDHLTVEGEEVPPLDTSEVRNNFYGRIESAGLAPSYMSDTDVELTESTSDTPVKTVETYADLPRHTEEWPDVQIRSSVIVLKDETHDNHRMKYTVRSYAITGYIMYDEPEYADLKWNNFYINWMQDNFYPDKPTLKAQYPDADWNAKTYKQVENEISDGKVEQKFEPEESLGTYIHDITVDDLSVFNYTTNEWEDLHDESKWRLEVYTGDTYGFRLYYLEDGIFSYDMKLFLNKVPRTQEKNAELKERAAFKISSYIYDEIDTKTRNISINTGRELRIRKLFPFEQKESFHLTPDDKEMRFKVANYMHFRNELHLEDIKIYNHTAGRFENVFNQNLFEVKFKDKKAVETGWETQTKIVQAIITDPGEGFTDGDVWAWNEEFGIQVFGQITADYLHDGHMITFTPVHCPNLPTEDISLEFQIYQHAIQWNTKIGQAIIEFQTERTEVHGDGYIHNVTNRMAPLPKEFSVVCKYDFDQDMDYEIIIDKNPKTWEFIKDDWSVFPTFVLPDVNIQQNRIYITNDKGRIPLVNPSTGKPSINVIEKDNSTEVLYMNLYSKYEHLQIHVTPYPMRSVYVQRRVPENGYVDVKGRINKPLDKKYFEFWMNGRLLSDEVTIISPTKIFLHGLKSLRNFEIIEINRDPNEFFSDDFIGHEVSVYDNPYPVWNLRTYLDDALEGNLEGDNYTDDEQESLLTPVWKQVEREHPEYRNYPPNLDTEPDILLRVDAYSDMSGIPSIPYQFAVVDVPTIEGIPINSRSINFTDFGFEPMTNEQIVSLLDDEWKDEISGGTVPSHTIISDEEWYGMATRLYDEYGMLVHTLNDSAYQITDTSIIRINTDTRIARLAKSTQTYDLS